MVESVSDRSARSQGLPLGGPDEELLEEDTQVPLPEASFLPTCEQVAIPGEPLVLPGDDLQHLIK